MKQASKTGARSRHAAELWARDASLWTGTDEAKWLAWLDIVADRTADLKQLQAFQDEVNAAGFTDVLLLGMGGSSLGPEVLAETFGKRGGFPTLHVLDSTDPQQIAAFEKKVTLPTTLVIVSSKSGGTLEPNILKAYFCDAMKKAVGDKAGEHFVAITDPGSHMQKVAENDGFRHIFYGDPAIGGRYSVLSNFGMVPAAAMGLDLEQFLQCRRVDGAGLRRRNAAAAEPGRATGHCAGRRRRQGATRSPSSRRRASTTSVLGWSSCWRRAPASRATASCRWTTSRWPTPRTTAATAFSPICACSDAPDPAQEKAIEALEKAGQPVVRVEFANTLQLGQLFFLWEFATAVAGSIIGIDAFDQPDVEASKVETKKLTSAYNDSGKLPDETPFLTDGAIQLFSDEKNAPNLPSRQHAGSGDEGASGAARSGRLRGVAGLHRADAGAYRCCRTLRTEIRDAKKVATVAEFGPRFLHSTGQAYKGGPNSGVFLQITARMQRIWRCRASATRSASSRRRRRVAISTCWPSAAAGRCACISPVTWRLG